MNVTKFVKTIYLGDRICKAVIINGQENEVKIHIDVISRIRDVLGNWNFYNDENIEDGLVVFTEVEQIRFEPEGLIPNGYINEFEFEEYSDSNDSSTKFQFKIYVGAYNKFGDYDEVVITIIAKSLHIEDPSKPGIKICE